MRHPSLKLLLAVLALALSAQRAHGQSASTPPAECPQLKVSCPEVTLTGLPVVFTVENAPTAGVTYGWVVSAGAITTGQGTPALTVDTTGVGNQHVTATVEAKGLPASCPHSASCTASVAGIIDYMKLDEYGNIPFEDEKARLDNLGINLLNSPDFKGYIVGYGGRRARVGEARRRIERAKKYLAAARRIAPERIVAIDGGYRENLTIELWSLPAEAGPPYAAPTVDPSEVTIIRASPRRRPKRR